MSTLVIAIDPGQKGGIAVKRPGELAYAINMPPTDGDVIQLFASIAASTAVVDRIAVIEEIAKHTQGRPLPASTVAVIYGQYRFLIGALQSTGWRVEIVRPQRWQKIYCLGTRSACATDSVWKNKLKAQAQRLFPSLKITLNTADALLILEYWFRTSFAQPGPERTPDPYALAT